MKLFDERQLSERAKLIGVYHKVICLPVLFMILIVFLLGF